MLAFLGGLFLAGLAVIALAIIGLGACHNAWVQFLTGSDKNEKE